MKRKKSKFWLFCFSFIPGAGEMYLGFMKMGISLMGIFLGICFLASFLEVGSLLFFNIIIWFYSFFHAHNLGNMPDEEFYNMEDQYLLNIGQFTPIDFSEKTRTFVAWALIIVGAILVFNNFWDVLANIIPFGFFQHSWLIKSFGVRFVAGVGIIFVGVQLIRGKSESMEETRD